MAGVTRGSDTHMDLEVLGTGTLQQPLGQAAAGSAMDRARATAALLFGKSMNISENRTVDLDYYQSGPVSARGLALAISGSANVVNVSVAQALAGYEDPIRAVLGSQITDTARVIVKRRFVQGSNTAMPVPERAPARVVSVVEREREVQLVRYGCDIDFNTNLLLKPDEARADLDMKLKFQQNAMANRLVSLGYQAVYKSSTDAVLGLIKNNPAMARLSGRELALASAEIYSRDCFGALSKYRRALSTCLALAKRAAPYNAEPYDVAVVPSGIEYESFTKADNVEYQLSGLRANNGDGRPFTFAIKNAYTDPGTGINCLLSRPLVSYSAGGTLSPEADGEGGIVRRVAIMQFHDVFDEQSIRAGDDLKVNHVMNYQTKQWESLEEYVKTGGIEGSPNKEYDGNFTTKDGDGKNVRNDDLLNKIHDAGLRVVIVRPHIQFAMGSCIVAKGGSGTGELLSAFPNTSTQTTAVSPETMRMQLRTYFGAEVYRPENICVVPDCHFFGCTSGYKLGKKASGRSLMPRDDEPTGDFFFALRKVEQTVGYVSVDGTVPANAVSDIFTETATPHYIGGNWAKDDANQGYRVPGRRSMPAVGYLAASASYNKEGRLQCNQANTGHLGTLDNPERCSALWGQTHFVGEVQDVRNVAC